MTRQASGWGSCGAWATASIARVLRGAWWKPAPPASPGRAPILHASPYTAPSPAVKSQPYVSKVKLSALGQLLNTHTPPPVGIIAGVTCDLQPNLSVCRCCSVTQSCPTLCDPMACQAPLSIAFPRQEHWSGLPFPTPGDPPNPGMEPESLALAGGFLTV